MSKLDENAIVDFDDTLVSELYANGMEIHVQTVYGIINYTSSTGRKWRIRAENDLGAWVVSTSLDNFSVVDPAENSYLEDAIQEVKDNVEVYEKKVSNLLKLKPEMEARGYELEEGYKLYSKDVSKTHPHGQILVKLVDDGSWHITIWCKQGIPWLDRNVKSEQELFALLDGEVENAIKELGGEGCS